MWKRIKRIFKSIFGGVLSEMEDPVLILEQNIRDMKDQVPKMNENIALMKANVTLLDRELKKLADRETKLISNIKAAIQSGRDDIAADYASTLEQVKSSKISATGQHKTASMAFEKAMEVKKAFMKEIDKKSKEAVLAIQEAKRAKWQKQVADTMEQFEVGGIDQTHDDMIAKIEQESATAEARLELSMDGIDSEKAGIEEEAEKMRASELVKQFKIEMGMDSSGTVANKSTDSVQSQNKEKTQ